MLLMDIKHVATRNAVERKNIDVSKFDDLTSLRRYMKHLNFKKYHENHKEEYNLNIKKYYYEKKKKLVNGLSGKEIRELKNKLNKIMKKKKNDLKFR